MPNTVALGKCDNCGELRSEHAPDGEGLKLRCADGGRFTWPRARSRASASFNDREVKALDSLVAAATTGARVHVPPSLLGALRRKTLAMRKKVE